MPANTLKNLARFVPTPDGKTLGQSQRMPAAFSPILEVSIRRTPLLTLKEPVCDRGRVVVVDQDSKARIFFTGILQTADAFKFAGDFSNAGQALNAVPDLRPDIMLLGIRPHANRGFEYIRRFKRILVALKIIVVTGMGNLGMDGIGMLDSFLQAGAEACLVEPVSQAQCLATLRCVNWKSNPKKIWPESSHEMHLEKCISLNQKEREVMDCLAEGLFYKEISDKLRISYAMVHKYQHRIFKKLRVVNRWEATRVWLNSNGGI